MGNFISKLEEAVKAIGHKIAGAFVAIFGKEVAADWAKATEALLANSPTGQIAVKVVTDVQNTMATASNDVKYESAKGGILKELEALGVQIGESLLNLLIELAVQKVKGSLPALVKL